MSASPEDPDRTPREALAPRVGRALIRLREEERAARDLYDHLARWYGGSRPFANIVEAEDRHFEAVGSLLRRYRLADPSRGLPRGSYADPEIQALYDAARMRGERSWADALAVGAELERQDIADCQELSRQEVPGDVRTVMQRLIRASQRHLDAFVRAAERAESRDAGPDDDTGASRQQAGRQARGHAGRRRTRQRTRGRSWAALGDIVRE